MAVRPAYDHTRLPGALSVPADHASRVIHSCMLPSMGDWHLGLASPGASGCQGDCRGFPPFPLASALTMTCRDDVHHRGTSCTMPPLSIHPISCTMPNAHCCCLQVLSDARQRAEQEPLLLARNWVVAVLVFLLWMAGIEASIFYVIGAYGEMGGGCLQSAPCRGWWPWWCCGGH